MAFGSYPNIPSAAPRSGYAPVPGGGTIASLGGQTIQPMPGGQEAPLGYAPTAGAAGPAASAVPASGYSAGAFNVPTQNVPFNPQSFVGSDAYNFINSEGMNDIQRGAAAKGTLLTGGTMKDLARWGQGNAATFWGQQLAHDTDMAGLNAGILEGNANRTVGGLSSLSGLGFGAAQGMGNAAIGTGNAAAGGTIGAQNAANVGFAGVTNTLGDWFARRRQQQQANPQNYPAPTMPIPANPGPVTVG